MEVLRRTQDVQLEFLARITVHIFRKQFGLELTKLKFEMRLLRTQTLKLVLVQALHFLDVGPENRNGADTYTSLRAPLSKSWLAIGSSRDGGPSATPSGAMLRLDRMAHGRGSPPDGLHR
jgi:hypothetical protein